MRAELYYLSSACNRSKSACDWGKNGLICYVSCKAVIIYDPKHTGTSKVRILIGHTKKVVAVKWVRTRDDSKEDEIVSVSNDGTAIIWTLNPDEDNYTYVVLRGHKNFVDVVDCMYLDTQKNSLIVVTSSLDSTIRVWKRNNLNEDVENVQTIDLERGLSMALSLTFLPGENELLLACARDNSLISLYTQVRVNDTQQFKFTESLKGHTDWVQGLDFTTDDKGNVLLASGAHDSYIRIWCVSPSTEAPKPESLAEMLAKRKMRAMESHFSVVIDNETKHFTVHLQSVLNGHEGWVYAVNWAPKVRNEDGTFTQPMKLLSASIDKTMLIWTLDDSTGLWMETVRVGEVGGNTLGFYGCKFSPDGKSMVAHGYMGSFHMWHYSEETNSWVPGVTVGGHSNEAVDLAWEPNGDFLMSASLDQTTRVHAPWLRDQHEVSWHELARPQVHGYDMSCLALLSRYKFVSGGAEKIVRAFKAPSNFVGNFRRLCNVKNDNEGDKILNASSGGPRGASVPSLGLSNKAVYDSSNDAQAQPKGKDTHAEDSYFHEVQMEAPPTEENLVQNTLWPEIQKLYGHGYEVYSLAASADGKFVTSACKASTPEHAAIILWDANTWEQKQKLLSHTLTVTRMAFSPDSNRLLSVSRDRRLSVFEKDPETSEFVLKATTDKTNGVHTRIIWCCAWSHDGKYFATCSRDGIVVMWWKNEAKEDTNSSLGFYESLGTQLELTESIGSVAFAPILIDGSYLLCMGMDSGILMFYKWSREKNWEKCLELSERLGHHSTVKRMSFRPKVGLAGVSTVNEKVLQLASCSCDNSVQIHNIYLD